MPETEKLKGIKQVLETEYQDAVHNGEAQGYLWFVRADAVSVTNRIYLGTRLYGEAEITVPLGQLITNITSEDGSITVSLETADNGTTADLKLTLDPDGGLAITENGLAIATANFATKDELTKVNETIATVNDNLVQSVNTLNQNMADGFNTINGGIDNEIRPAIEKNTADIVAETERAVQAETNLQTNINAETETRKIDVQNLQANINAEVETRKIDVQNLQGNINAETERAKAAEEDLRKLIAGTGSTTELEQKIDDEVARATAAEEKIRQDVVSGFTVINENVTTIVNTLNKNMSDGFNTINGGINNEIRPAIEKNAEDIKTLNETVATVNDNLVQSVNTLNQNMVDGFNTINGGIDNEIRPELEKAVKYDDIATEQNPGRKAITLKNHDMLLGTNTAGSTANIAMINKWDVVDLGTSSLPINMNTPAGVRPTVQEAGQTGEEAHKIAYLSDIEGVETDLENVVKYDDVSTPEKPNRKALTLKNDDLILGATTSGGSVNIAMVNKWDVVDLGSNQLPINLNTPAGVRPTVQEAGQTGEQANQIAYLSDIEANKTDLSDYYTKEETDQKFADLVANAPEELNTLKEIADKLADGDDVAAALTKQISDVSTKLDSEISRSTQKDTETDTRLATLETSNTELRNKSAELESKIDVNEQGIAANKSELEKAVKYDDIATEENPGRKAITLKNHDMLLGTTTSGGSVNIGMVNKWDIVDLGSSALPINLNTPAGVRPTVQEAGQTGEEAHKIAYLSDIEGVEAGLENVVKYDDVSTPEKPNRKAIALKNDDLILGATTSGGTVNIAMVNKWDVVDLGSNQLPINLNTPAGVRPTVQEAGQTGEQANQIAYLSDIEAGVQYENIGGIEKNISVGVNAGYYATSADGTKQKMMEMDGNAVAIGSESNPLKLQASETPQVVIGTQNKFMVLSDENDSIATIKQSVETEKVRALAAEKANTDAIGAEVTRATEAEEDLDTRLKVIEESGQTLPNDVALKGRGVNDVPQVDLLKVDGENRICVGSNLGQLRLISKGNPAYVIDGEEKNLATADEIPSTLPNPNALSIKLNGAEVASYDGSAATEADVKVNAENLPMSEEDATTVSTKLSGIQNSVFGEIDVTKFMSENGHTAQFITSLEESYISDLGTPENIDNKPYNASTNNYVLGQSYLVFGKFDDTLTFHYDMYSNATMGFLMRTFMLGFKTLEDKVNTLTEKVAALESAGN